MDTARLATQLQDVNDYLALLDATLPLVINTAVINETMGAEAAAHSDAVYQAIRNSVAIDWMMQNNIAPELYKLFTVGNDDDNPGNNFLAARLDKVTTISKFISDIMTQLATKNGGGETTEAAPAEPAAEEGGDDFGFAFGDEEGAGGEEGGEEAPSEEETPAE